MCVCQVAIINSNKESSLTIATVDDKVTVTNDKCQFKNAINELVSVAVNLN